MAIYESNRSNGYYLTSEVTVKSTDISRNVSRIGYKLYLHFTNKVFEGASELGYFYCEGAFRWKSTAGYRFDTSYINGKYLLSSGEFDAFHDEEGGKAIHIEAYFSATTGGWGPSAMKIDSYMVLPKIPRASTHTLISGGHLGESLKFRIDRKHDKYSDSVYWKWEGSSEWNLIGNNLKDSFSVTLPLSLAEHAPNSSTLNIVTKNQTYNGSDVIGSPYEQRHTIHIPDSVKPSITGTITSTYDRENYIWNKFIQDKCRAKMEVKAQAQYNASIKKYRFKQGDTILENETGVFYTQKLIQAGNIPISFWVQDSRGKWSREHVTMLKVIPYINPIINAVEIYRSNSAGIEDVRGSYYSVRVDVGYSECEGLNALNLRCRHKQSSSSSYGNEVTLLNKQQKIIGVISNTKSYIVEVIVSDAITESKSVTEKIPTEFVLLNCTEGGTGVAIGKYSEIENTFENGFQTFMSETVEAENVNTANIQAESIKMDNVEYKITESEYNQMATKLGAGTNIKRLSDLLSRIVGRLGVDWIVEKSTENGWKYEKWNSGKVIAKKAESKSTGIFKNYNAPIYWNGDTHSGSFPSVVKYIDYASMYPQERSGAILFSHFKVNNDTKYYSYYFSRLLGGNDSIQVNAFITVEGRWK